MINGFRTRYCAKTFAEKVGMNDFMIVKLNCTDATIYQIYLPLNLLGHVVFPTRYAARVFAEEAGLGRYAIRKVDSNVYVIYVKARILERAV